MIARIDRIYSWVENLDEAIVNLETRLEDLEKKFTYDTDWCQRPIGFSNFVWFDMDCKLSIARRNEALNRMRRTKSGNSVAVTNFVKERNVTRNLCRAKKKPFLQKINKNLASGDSKQFWRFINFFVKSKYRELPDLDWVAFFSKKFHSS
ncbi:uncharacterized protein LOC111628745 [Centruroides sculpturatus]|uniref:uncharacterized protein LOC111628745 n=1 Tax=Centruroides sculpturatus TaxID=218467 RepID=UPI000C6EFAA6|nr:uncharacterized protein LOC111628745 [Centruroides sculpturatus]